MRTANARTVTEANPLGASENWKLWCRLCAKEDPQKNIKLFVKHEYPQSSVHIGEGTGETCHGVRLAAAIEKYFSVNILGDEELPQVLCTGCFSMMTSLTKFSERVSKVQRMFEDLQVSAGNTQFELHAMRLKYDMLEDFEEHASLLQDQSVADESCFESKPNVDQLEALDTDTVESNPIEQAFIVTEVGFNKVFEVEDDDNDYEDFIDGDDDEDNESLQEISNNINQIVENDDDEQDEATSSIQREPQELKCSVCNRLFPTKDQLNKHEFLHLTCEMKKVLPCPHCPKRFKADSLLRTHIKHVHLNVRPFKCEKCSVAVKTRSLLKEHMLTHTDFAPFECEICKKGCKTQHRLKMHMESHDTVKRICPECGLQLKNRSTFNRHMVVHREKSKHICDYCGRSFKRGDGLKYHLLVHTGLKPYSCNFCERTYASGLNCRLHQQKRHAKELAELEATGEAAGSGSTYTLKKPTLEELKEVAKTANNLAPAPARQSRKTLL